MILTVMLKLLGKYLSNPREMLRAVFSANIKTSGAQILKDFRESGDQ